MERSSETRRSAGSTESTSDNQTHLLLYKTQLCRAFSKQGKCKYGMKCQFAHGKGDLREASKHPKFRTAKCKFFSESGKCPFGKECAFLHEGADKNEIQSEQNNFQSERRERVLDGFNVHALLPKSFFEDDPVFEPSSSKRMSMSPTNSWKSGESKPRLFSETNIVQNMTFHSSDIVTSHRKSEGYALFPKAKQTNDIWEPREKERAMSWGNVPIQRAKF